MYGMGVSEIGEIIRKVRKQQGKRLEDLADEKISPATISNIERGVSHVRQDKVDYLLDKLNISLEKIPELILGEKEQLSDLKFELDAIESLKRMGQWAEALKALNRLDLSDDHPYAPEYYWLKGTIHLFQKKYPKAERSLIDAIRLSKQSGYAANANIEAYSFNDLSLCSYFQNDLERALQYTKSGLAALNPEGERDFVKYILLRNQATYLERLGRVVEALRIVEDIWDELPRVQKAETVLGFYWLKSELLRKSGALEDATRVAREGLKLASLNRHFPMTYDHWVVLGSIYMDQEDWEKAETSLNISLKVAENHVDDSRVVRGYIQLGLLNIQKKQWQSAKEALQAAITKGEKLQSTAYLTDAFLTMGNLYSAQDQLEEAVGYFHKAAELSEQHQYKDKKVQAWYHLAMCLKDRIQMELQ